MITTEQLDKIEQDMDEFASNDLSMAHIPISVPDVQELVQMARRYAWLTRECEDKDVIASVFNDAPHRVDAAIDQAIAGERR